MSSDELPGGREGVGRRVDEVEVMDLDEPRSTASEGASPAAASASAAGDRPLWSRAGVVGPVCGVLGLLTGLAVAGPAAGPPTASSSTPGATTTATTIVTVPTTVTDPGVTETVTVFPDTAGANPTPAPGTDITEDGTYRVGVDIEAGEYVTVGQPTCTWTRLKATDGKPTSVIAKNAGSGQQVVSIATTDKAFQTQGCGSWVKADAAP